MVIVLLTLVFVGSAVMMIRQFVQYREAEKVYSEAAELVSLPDLEDLPSVSEIQEEALIAETEENTEQVTEPEAPEQVWGDPYADALRTMDFAALREVNPDVLGWILIPNTKVSYPVVQGEDNSYYLKRTWRKTRSDVGAIFVECQNSGDLSDFNTIIYGHRMNNRSMFGTLDSYKDAAYLAQHPNIYITDDNGCHTYEIFAAYEVGVTGTTYRIGMTEDVEKQAYIDWCAEQSVVDTGVVPTVYDRIVTLSTCTGRGHETRWVVQGVLRGEVPAEAKAPAEEEPTAGEALPQEGTEIVPETEATEESPAAADAEEEPLAE